jgi:hypothetical protein
VQGRRGDPTIPRTALIRLKITKLFTSPPVKEVRPIRMHETPSKIFLFTYVDRPPENTPMIE